VIPGPEGHAPAASGEAPAVGMPPARYVLLRDLSLALIVLGGGTVAFALVTTTGLLSGELLEPGSAADARAMLIALVAGAAALVLGLVMHAVRSLVVRETLPPERYRGPSIIVLWLLATVAANLAVVPVASGLSELVTGGAASVYSTVVTLTVTQAGLVASAALLVFAPRALAGLRLVPRRGLLTSIAIGLGLVVPSWIGAQVISYLTLRALEPFGLQPETGIADAALTNADPLVLVVALVVVAPIAEELFFRGVAYNAWEREYGQTRALYGSAILFAVIHGSLFVIPSIFALGIVLALLFRATRSLPATIILHAGFNAITVLIALLVRFNVLDIPLT
jgi:membrane protease YdiL (CAAX protease family)